MLIYVIFKCKCAEMIGLGAAGMEVEGRSCALMAANRQMLIIKQCLPAMEQNKYLPFVDFLFHTMVSWFLWLE